MKICNKCEIEKQNNDFCRNAKNKSGLSNICKSCLKTKIDELSYLKQYDSYKKLNEDNKILRKQIKLLRVRLSNSLKLNNKTKLNDKNIDNSVKYLYD